MGWKLNDLNDGTNAPVAIFKPSGYMFTNQGTQHVVYQGFGDVCSHSLSAHRISTQTHTSRGATVRLTK
jgi:hypothetical protein